MDIVNPALKKRRQKKQFLLGAVAIAAVSLLAAAILRMGPALPKVERASLWIDTVTRGDMLREVRATGTLVPREIRWVAAATPAQVERIEVRPGASVTADTVLMRLANPEVEDALRNAQAQLAAAEADVIARRAELDSELLNRRSALAQAEADHASAAVRAIADAKAAELDLIPRVQYEQGQIALRQLATRKDIEAQRVATFAANMKAQMDAVLARAAQQRSTLELRQRQADALVVTAGIDGVLQEIAVQEGSRVAQGANLARVARPDVLMARLKVPEVQAKDIAIGMPVDVDTRNGHAAGKVERIDPSVRDGSVEVDVALEGALPPGARPDQSIDGRIRIATLDDVLSLGRPALAESGSRMSLFRVDPAGDIATRVPVELGAASVDRIVVRNGLAAGDRVILSDTSQFDQYDRLRLR